MIRLLKILLILLVILIGVFFTLQNPDMVPVDFYYFQFSAPLSLTLVACLLIGAVLGWLLAMLRMLPRIRSYRRMQKKYADAEAEITNLRKLPITDEP